jgi:STE24 endopeptidase
MEQILLYVMAGIIAAQFLLETVLDRLNERAWPEEPPAELADSMDREVFRRSREYNRDRDRLSLVSSTLSTVILLAFLLAGGFGWIDRIISGWIEHPVITPILFFLLLGLLSMLLSLPFSIWSTFVIEERYGFNRTTPVTFVLDRIKSLVLSGIIASLLLAGFILFYRAFPELYWVYAWIMITAVTLFFTTFYTSVIVPLFNKLTPLPEGELRSAIEEYSKRIGFPLKGLSVMDGSKRSSKGNAYFSGIGPRKRIVLFDTLIEKHDTGEILSILAHEVGHYRKRHVTTGFILSSVTMLFTLWVLSLVIESPELSRALGADSWRLHLGMLSFALLYQPLSLVLGVATGALSRRNEYQADAFAAETSSAGDLARALRKLSTDHLSHPAPHPAYVFFHYSHPPVVKRIRRLGEMER